MHDMNFSIIEHNHINMNIRFIKSQPKILVKMTKNTVKSSISYFINMNHYYSYYLIEGALA